MKDIYFGLLGGKMTASESPYLVWNKIIGGDGAGFETYEEASEYCEAKNANCKKESGDGRDRPFDVYCMFDGMWHSIDRFVKLSAKPPT